MLLPPPDHPPVCARVTANPRETVKCRNDVQRRSLLQTGNLRENPFVRLIMMRDCSLTIFTMVTEGEKKREEPNRQLGRRGLVRL